VQSGYWPLFRFDPRLKAQGKNPLQLDSRPPSVPLEQYMYGENRFKQLVDRNPERAAELLALAKEDVATRWKLYENWSKMAVDEK